MNYTRTAAGLLSAQYRSVLKKCFLINMGLFALGAVTATPAQASIDDYKGVEYTGKGTDTAATTLYFKWVQDTNLGIYKLEQTADAAEADITTKNIDERTFGGDADVIPGYDIESKELSNVVYSNIPRGANVFISEQAYDGQIKKIDGTYVANNLIGIDATVGPIGAALSNNMKLGIINGNFIGNSITTSYVTYVGPSDYFGAGYGGAIYNSYVNQYYAHGDFTPSASGIIEGISGNFVANGVTITSPTGQTPTIYMDYTGTYYAFFTEGAFGGAITNHFGTIGAINNAVFENNYVLSTATSGSKGNIGGAGVYNSASKYIWRRGYPGFQPVTSSIGSITANFNENVAHTENGNISGGTILNVANENGTATIGNISGNFNKNSAVALKGNVSGSVIGNILEHPVGTATIGTISGTYTISANAANKTAINGTITLDKVVLKDDYFNGTIAISFNAPGKTGGAQSFGTKITGNCTKDGGEPTPYRTSDGGACALHGCGVDLLHDTCRKTVVGNLLLANLILF